MKKISKSSQLKIGVVLTYLTTGLNMVVKLIYTPVMLRLVGQSEYGLYTLVGSVVAYLSLFGLGLSGSYLRFYSRYAKDNDRDSIGRLNGMFLCIFLCISGAALICGFIMAQYTPQIFGSKLTPDELGRAKILFEILVVNIALGFPASIFTSITSAHEEFLFQRIMTLGAVIFDPLITLPLLMRGYGSVAMVSVTTGISLVSLIINAWYCLKRLRVPFAFHDFDFSLLREIAGFNFFIFLNMIIDQINWNVDKFILGRIAGTKVVAVYGVGATINSLYIGFSTAISSVFAPRVNRIAADNAKDMNQQFTQLFIKVGRIQYMVLSLIASGLVFFGKFFITDIYAGSEYGEAYTVALLLILPATIPLIENLGIEIQRSVNKHKFRSIVYLVMAAVNVAVSIPLARAYGASGAAFGTCLSMITANGFIMNIYYDKAIGINVFEFWRSIARMSAALIAPVIFGVLINKFVHFHSAGYFVLCIALYSAVYFISFWFIGMNDFERELIRKPMRRHESRMLP